MEKRETLFDHIRPTKRLSYEPHAKEFKSVTTLEFGASDSIPVQEQKTQQRTKARESKKNSRRRKASSRRKKTKKRSSKKRNSVKKLSKTKSKRVKRNSDESTEKIKDLILNLQKVQNSGNKSEYKIITDVDGEDQKEEEHIKVKDKGKKSLLENIKRDSKVKLAKLAHKKNSLSRKVKDAGLSEESRKIINSLRIGELETVQEEIDEEAEYVSNFDPQFVKELKLSPKSKNIKEENPKLVLVEKFTNKNDFRFKFSHLLQEELELPKRFKDNLEILHCVDHVLGILKIKKKIIFISELRRHLQSKLDRKVYLKNLQELDWVGGQLFHFRRTLNMKNDTNEVYVDFFGEKEEKMSIPTPEKIIERRKRTKDKYLSFVKEKHDQFLAENNIHGFDIQQEKCWHPRFNVEDLNFTLRKTPLPKDNTKIHAESMVQRYSRELTESRMSLGHKKLNLGESLSSNDKTIFSRNNILERLRQAGLLEMKKEKTQDPLKHSLSKEDIKTKLRYIRNKQTGRMEVDRNSLSNLGSEAFNYDSNLKLEKIQKRILAEIKKKEEEQAVLDKEAKYKNRFGFLGPQEFKKVIDKINWYYRSRKVSTAFYVKLRDYIRKNMGRNLDNFQIKGIIDKLVQYLGDWIEYRQVPQGLLVKIKKHHGSAVLFDQFVEKFKNNEKNV